MVFFVGGADHRRMEWVDLTREQPAPVETRINRRQRHRGHWPSANGKISAGNGGHWPSGSFSGVCGLAVTA